MRRLLSALAVLALTACISDNITIPGRTVGVGGESGSGGLGGTYTLQTIAGAPLPYTFAQNSSGTQEMLEDVITMTNAGT